MHAGDVVHRPADVLGGDGQREAVDRLEQDTLCRAQALPYRAVGRLSEVAALGVLEMSASDEQRLKHTVGSDVCTEVVSGSDQDGCKSAFTDECLTGDICTLNPQNDIIE